MVRGMDGRTPSAIGVRLWERLGGVDPQVLTNVKRSSSTSASSSRRTVIEAPASRGRLLCLALGTRRWVVERPLDGDQVVDELDGLGFQCHRYWPSWRSGSGSLRSAPARESGLAPTSARASVQRRARPTDRRSRSDSFNPAERGISCHSARSASLARIFTAQVASSAPHEPLPLGGSEGALPPARRCRGPVKRGPIGSGWLPRR